MIIDISKYELIKSVFKTGIYKISLSVDGIKNINYLLLLSCKGRCIKIENKMVDLREWLEEGQLMIDDW